MKLCKCDECGNDFESKRRKKRCPECAKNRWNQQMKDGHQRRVTQRSSNGMCVDCGKEKIVGASQYCERHWIQRLVRTRFGLKGESAQTLCTALLKKLHAQNFTCYYTGMLLTPGLNASIEHLLPESHHPELVNAIENLVWVRVEVNIMRSNLAFNDFLMFCKACLESETIRALASAEILQKVEVVI